MYDLEGSEKAATDFGLPEWAAKPVGILLPLAEIGVAIMLLPLSTAWYGGVAALALLTIFTLAMTMQMARGNAPDCHCFGQIHSEPVGRKSILRNIFFMIVAAFLVAEGSVSPGESVASLISDQSSRENLGYLIAIISLALLFSILAKLREMSVKLAEMQQQIETLQLVSEAQGSHQHHEHMTPPDEGLPIGAPAPDFHLPDMNGKAVSLEQLLMPGSPVLFFFISPTCSPCKALLPEIEKWQEEFSGRIEFVFISTGTAEDNTAKLPQLSGQTLLLQKKREVAELFKAKWTPTVLLVNAAGMIASRPAAGDTAIRDLIDRIAESDAGTLNHVENGSGMSPNELKIGEEIPEFELSEIRGEAIGDDAIRGKKTLALFWGPDCPHCERMLPEVKKWEASANGEVQLVVFSTGDEDKNRAMNLRSPILMDEGNKVGNKLGMFGTPSAVLIDERGRIVSETAIGAEQIWALIGKRK